MLADKEHHPFSKSLDPPLYKVIFVVKLYLKIFELFSIRMFYAIIGFVLLEGYICYKLCY